MAYLLRADGKIASRIDLFCEDEEAAKLHAKNLAKDCVVELWQGARRIAVYQPTH
ncbi:hypothetical protein ABIE91_009170 [Bradyrhizobium elkanii]